MPELPEVEVVRRGLDDHVVGRTILASDRRGKYLWVELDSDEALLAHLGMSGQMLVRPVGFEDEIHLRVRLRFADKGSELRFVDQRTFGGLSLEELTEVDGSTVPVP